MNDTDKEQAVERIQTYFTDTVKLINEAYHEGDIEGAQDMMIQFFNSLPAEVKEGIAKHLRDSTNG